MSNQFYYVRNQPNEEVLVTIFHCFLEISNLLQERYGCDLRSET